ARPSKASPPAAALARAGEVSLQNPARPTAVEASPPFSSGTKRPRQDARRSNSDRRRRPSAESGHAESLDRSLSVSSQRFEVPCALDPSGALCKFSAWHTSLCHAGSPIRRNLPTRHFSRDRALGTKLEVTELSRKALLLDRQTGGLRRVDEREASYLPSAGNDYFFASAQVSRTGRDEAVLVPLRKRCQSCHGED